MMSMMLFVDQQLAVGTLLDAIERAFGPEDVVLRVPSEIRVLDDADLWVLYVSLDSLLAEDGIAANLPWLDAVGDRLHQCTGIWVEYRSPEHLRRALATACALAVREQLFLAASWSYDSAVSLDELRSACDSPQTFEQALDAFEQLSIDDPNAKPYDPEAIPTQIRQMFPRLTWIAPQGEGPRDHDASLLVSALDPLLLEHARRFEAIAARRSAGALFRIGDLLEFHTRSQVRQRVGYEGPLQRTPVLVIPVDGHVWQGEGEEAIEKLRALAERNPG